jgi:uncharacterized DUF497 family protein
LGVFDGDGHGLNYPIEGVALADGSFSMHGSHADWFKSLGYLCCITFTLCMYNKFRIIFDPDKNRQNQSKHDGLSLSDAEGLDWNGAADFLDQRRDYGEDRVVALAYMGRRLVVVVFVDRGDERRIISLRKANFREVKRYAKT